MIVISSRWFGMCNIDQCDFFSKFYTVYILQLYNYFNKKF